MIICPKCKNKHFSWAIDKEVSKMTLWGCGSCGYTAEEDESQEIYCPRCGKKTYMLLQDDTGKYRYCGMCQLTEIVDS